MYTQANTFVTTVIGLGKLEAVKLLIVINAAGIPVRPLIGYGADHWFGAVNTLITCVTSPRVNAIHLNRSGVDCRCLCLGCRLWDGYWSGTGDLCWRAGLSDRKSQQDWD